MTKLRIVIGNGSLARYPQGGGHWTVRLQYLLGLKDLGHRPFLLERLQSTGDDANDNKLIKKFFENLSHYGLKEDSAIILLDDDWREQRLENAKVCGKSLNQIKEIIKSADLLWNDCGHIRSPLLNFFQKKIMVDLDPGSFQVSSTQVDTDHKNHDFFFTVGLKLNDKDCEVPALGVKWHTFAPFVYLPMWDVKPDPGPNAPFSSITHWGWGEHRYNGRVLSSSKRVAYMNYVDLPLIANRCFELSPNLHKDGPQADITGDGEILEQNGWKLKDPWKVAGTASAYQNYISRSRAEISCPKPIYRELNTGWFSDRSVCYLASGRPVLAENTGFSDHIPTGEGLVTFSNMEEAVEGVKEIDSNYKKHMKAARALVEEYFTHKKVLPEMLNSCLE